MPFVVDASMAMTWCFEDEATAYSRSVLETLRRSYAEVPALWRIEVKNVLLVNERRGRITTQGAREFLQMLPPLDDQVLFTLARRHGLTAYDAAYLELAKRRGLPLATLDKDLIRAAPLEGVALVRQA